ncbi:hypothetical protein C6497_06440 [Candidatus Poribacteria bacterium]|nr:MAG: hypothetical protein C6497_06440 [Candidatus Poribacteria bacterium]
MSIRDEFISFVDDFRVVSPIISEEQRKGLLRRAVHQHGLTVEDANRILELSGLVIGELQENYFEVLGILYEDIESKTNSEIADRVASTHMKLYRESLNSGGRPRPDGRSEEQWRRLLNQARDTLTDPQKRHEYITTIQEKDTFIAIASRTTGHKNMSLIHEGEFEMGSDDNNAFDDEQPIHTVFLDDFFIDQYPVTNGQFKEFLDANPQWSRREIPKKYCDIDYLKHWRQNNFPSGEANYPVVNVSWYAAMAYAQWQGKRLPTEAEWEKAARGGLINTQYPHGNSLDSTEANYDWNEGSTTPVGKYPANGYQLYDMCGNVWEWCLDRYEKHYYRNSPYRNPIAGDDTFDRLNNNFLDIKSNRVLRGGSWRIPALLVRTAKRNAESPWFSLNVIGFRCVDQVLQRDKSPLPPSVL